MYRYILPETNIGSENQWLEKIFPLGKAYMQGLILTYNSGNCNIDTTTNALGKKTTPSKYGNLKIYPCRISGVYLYHEHNVA